MKTRKIIAGLLILILVCLPCISASAATAPDGFSPDVEASRGVFNENDKPVYLYKFADGKGKLFTMPKIPDSPANEGDFFVGYSAVTNVNDGYVILNRGYSDGVMGRYDVQYALDTNADYIRYAKLDLCSYADNIYVNQLPNAALVTRSLTGRLQLHEPDGTKEIRLAGVYGKKLELPIKVEYLGEPVDFYTYNGECMTYNPHTEQYILIYGLSELYGTDGTKARKKASQMRAAIFDKSGAFVKRFVVKGGEVSGRSPGTDMALMSDEEWAMLTPPDSMVRGLAYLDTVYRRAYPMKSDPNKIFLTKGSYYTSEIMIDLEKEEVVEVTYQDKNDIAKASYAKSLPYGVDYRTDGTYIISHENGRVLHLLKGDYDLISPFISPDGAVYAIFAAGQEYSEHPYGT